MRCTEQTRAELQTRPDLWRLWTHAIAPYFQPTPGPRTVGVELEFFLCSEGRLVSLPQALAFFAALAAHPGWRAESAECVVHGTGKNATRLHFEYRPHLLEVSLRFFDNLEAFEQHLRAILVTLQLCAEKLNLQFQTPLRPLALPSNLTRDLSRLPVDVSRRAFCDAVFGNAHSEWRCDDFPAVTASMHIHLGGFDWTRPGALARLYRIERQQALQTWRALTPDEREADAAFDQRLELYHTSFPGLPLVGVPMAEWNRYSWLQLLALGPCPLRNGQSVWSTLQKQGLPPINRDYVEKLRDFQFIRPRTFGTVEFRSEPPTLDSEVILAAVRRRWNSAAELA